MPKDGLPICYADEVKAALTNDKAVVALESTIITHGMPYPQNVETARQVEDDIRACGAVPATIAVLDGDLHVGLETDDLDRLAHSRDVMKLSRGDLVFAIASGRTGSTTVAATMMVAHLSGIRVFATGGIGGVHRGAELNFDISADLAELAKTPVCVVAAGAKAILDLPKTFEVLETQGVPVVGFQTKTLPAFWSRDSGLAAPLTLETPESIAAFLKARNGWPGHGGELIANSVPAEFEIPAMEMRPIIEAALDVAATKGISGKDVTPFVLSEIFRKTDGRSLATNIALIRNNAQLAAKIAVGLRKG